MPSALRIRKEIIKALDETIIPALWERRVPLGYVAPPFQFPPNIEMQLLSNKLPRRSTKTPSFPIQAVWPKAHLHSTIHPYLSIIYQGAARERTFISDTQAAQFNIEKGIYSLEWQATGALLFPPDTPRNTGSSKYYIEDNPSPQRSKMKILQIAFRDTLLVHLRSMNTLEEESSHSLQVNDAALLALGNMFQQELRNSSTSNQETAQATLLTLMLHLRNHLSSYPPSLANTSYPQMIKADSSNQHTQEICQQTIRYIQTHLQEPLSLPAIAQKMGFSPTHLNRLFRQFSGVSIMRYVKQQRIAAAKKILELGTENIAEIAALTGFGSSTVFCRAFLRETNRTPNQYRRHTRQRKSTF